jgi:hypothetical protein
MIDSIDNQVFHQNLVPEFGANVGERQVINKSPTYERTRNQLAGPVAMGRPWSRSVTKAVRNAPLAGSLLTIRLP